MIDLRSLSLRGLRLHRWRFRLHLLHTYFWNDRFFLRDINRFLHGFGRLVKRKNLFLLFSLLLASIVVDQFISLVLRLQLTELLQLNFNLLLLQDVLADRHMVTFQVGLELDVSLGLLDLLQKLHLLLFADLRQELD